MNEIERPVADGRTIGSIREQAERMGHMLREQRSIAVRHQAVLAALAEGIVLTDEQAKVVLVNQSARHILRLETAAHKGPTPEDPAAGQPVGVLLTACSPESRAAFLQALESVLEQGSAQTPVSGNCQETLESECGEGDRGAEHEPVDVLLKIQERAVRASLTPILDEDDRFSGTVTVLRDVTAEQEIAQAKNEFVSLVSHELRTPMTSIKGYTDLLLKGAVGALNEQQQNFVSIVKANADRMAELVSDLLDISRLEAGRVRLVRERLDLASVILEISQELTETLRQRELALRFDLTPGLPRVYADRGRVVQVLLNLLSNAYRYTPPGGTITVSLLALEHEVQVDVTDTGIGIPEQDREAIFERFFRADHPVVREQAGTGLGLPIARSLIEMHGGRLWLRSEIGVGSTFSFTLPVYTED